MSLKALTVNTAPEENAHILAEDDVAIFQSIFGEDGVLEIGQQMKATVISNNKVRVADGAVCIGGHIARTVYGDYTDLTIENGESGKNRNDLIIGTFSTTGAGGIDTMQLVVKKGAAGTAATDPALTQGNLYTGSKLREVPLWRVKIEGLSITKVEQLFEIVPSIPTLKKELESLNGKTDLQMIPGNGMRFNTQWSDNYAIVKGDILYINFLIENTNGSYYKENTPHTLCKIKKPKSVKIGNRLSLAGYALSSSGSARANSGQVSLYTGVQDIDDMEIVFLTTDSSTYKMNVTGAILLR